MPSRSVFHALDGRLQFRDPGSAAITASATLGTVNEKVAKKTDYRGIFYVEAIKVSAGDELYTLEVQLSNDNFSTIEQVPVKVEMGDAAVLSAANDTAAGDEIEFAFCTEYKGVAYADWRLRLVISGTSPSITGHCYAAKD